MTVTIDFSPDEEHQLRERAGAIGQDVPAYLHQLVRDGLGAPSPATGTSTAPGGFLSDGTTEEEVNALLSEAMERGRGRRESEADRAARERFESHFGEIKTAGAWGTADNEAIDADLAREYADNHENG